MDMAVKRLILKRFRSVPSETVDLANPTFLVGRNGSGKSNLVDAFDFLAEAAVSPLHAVFDRRGGISKVRNRTSGTGYPPNMGLGVELGRLNGGCSEGRYAFEVKALPNYGFEVIREQCVSSCSDGRYYFMREGNEFSSNVKAVKPVLDPASLCLPVVGGDVRFAPILRALSAMRVYSIDPFRVREMQDPDSGVSLKRDGSNTASVLQQIERESHDDMERVCEILSTIAPNTTDVRAKKLGNKLSLEFTQEWGKKKRLSFEAFNMSDGTLRAIGLLAAVFQKPTPSLLVVEEPEATIHPGALGAVLDLLRHASRQMQVIVTTHSPDVLNAEWIEASHLRIVEWAEGATYVRPISDAARSMLKDHLMGAGDLMRSNVLEAERLFPETEDLRQQGLFEVVA